MSLHDFVSRSRIAYFTMEIAVHREINTYAGGLGILAGDTARSCADLDLPVVFVSLISHAGYFRQQIDDDGRQIELADWWKPAKWCTPLDAIIAVSIEGRSVWIRPWLYVHISSLGQRIPVLFLDTDLEQNSNDDRTLTNHLYGGDEAYRLKQEIVLGIGGVRLLRALGFDIQTYHLNEGHAALLTLELLDRFRIPPEYLGPGEIPYELNEVRERCVFTTHTPVEVGHDVFAYALFERLLPGFFARESLERLAGRDRLNMTQLALSLSGYVNGVARRHAETAKDMFPGHRIHAITNGIHVETWAHPAFCRLYQTMSPHWCHEPELLVRVLELPTDDVWNCHLAAKSDLLERVEEISGLALDPAVPVVGFARRMTGYKRPLLLFSDLERLSDIAARHPFQLVISGKAHPRDYEGKDAIARIHEIIRDLRGRVTCVYLPNYDTEIAKLMVAGSDVWLNTPLPPKEASGTSGMKAALNGVLNLSVLDGWWIEACNEGVTGWAIGTDGDGGPDASSHASALYDKLSGTVLPLYYEEQGRWRWMMKQAIGHIAYYFNSQRMMRRYASEAYLR